MGESGKIEQIAVVASTIILEKLVREAKKECGWKPDSRSIYKSLYQTVEDFCVDGRPREDAVKEICRQLEELQYGMKFDKPYKIIIK